MVPLQAKLFPDRLEGAFFYSCEQNAHIFESRFELLLRVVCVFDHQWVPGVPLVQHPDRQEQGTRRYQARRVNEHALLYQG